MEPKFYKADNLRKASRGDPRVHGNGFIQLDLEWGERVHFWGHPKIPQQVSRTTVHDHRFSFGSKVIRGAIINVGWHAVPVNYTDEENAGPTHTIYNPIPRDGEDTKLVRVTNGRFVPKRPELYREGDFYEMTIGELHETYVNQPTVTSLFKTGYDRDYKPRVLVPNGVNPDNDFNRNSFEPDFLWSLIEEITS